MVLRLSPVGCHVPPHGSHSAIDACHIPWVVAIAHDASRQRIQGDPLIVGQFHIVGVVPSVIFCIALVSSKDLLITSQANACHRLAAENIATSAHWHQ